ncbi:MAG TPA: hypothetical protein VEI82_15215, partial [Myxococcota bacterium]|nr:hypothetical protein [Myxococcota bacterium]
LPFAIALAWFQAKGALGDLQQVLFVFTPYYTKLSWEGRSVFGMGWTGFEDWLMTYSSALFAGIVLLLAMRPTRAELPSVVTLGAIIALHLAGVVMQGKFFPYHWGATFPLTALLAGLGWMKLARWAASKHAAALGIVACAFPLVAAVHAPVPDVGRNFAARTWDRFQLYVRGPMDPAKRDALASVRGVSMAQSRAVAEWVKAHTRPRDPIFVWGFACVIYDLSERPLASRYIYDLPQRAVWSRAEMQKALMSELAQSRPAVIVVQHGDVFAFVTGDDRDSAQSLGDFPELRTLLAEDYAVATTIGDFDVYLRSPVSAG